MPRCPHCNSEHEPDQYSVGYFDVDGEIVEVHGEENVLARMRDPDYPTNSVYWSLEALYEGRANHARILEEMLALNAFEQAEHAKRVAIGKRLLKGEV